MVETPPSLSPPGRLPAGRIAVGLLIGGAALVFAVRHLDGAALREALGGIVWGWLALAVAVDLGAFALRALKWRLLLGERAPSYGVLWRATMIGALATDVLPRSDELVRAQIVGRREGVGRAYTLGTLCAERLIDLGYLALLGGLVVAAWGLPTQLAVAAPILLLLVAGGLLSLPLLLRWLPARLAVPARELLTGALACRRRLPGAVGVGLLEWATLSAMFGCVMLSMGIIPTLQLCLSLLLASYLIFAVPMAPGQVGIYHLAIGHLLVGMGFAEHTAITTAIVAHACLILPTAIVGASVLPTCELGWRDMLPRRAEPAAAAAPCEEPA